ncbi:hypothetical protein [Microbacterium sp.]|uniref:hypothetical protein n=1 Tax=Microbacterium sp. TaxID=51671 RepID=UPI003221F924
MSEGEVRADPDGEDVREKSVGKDSSATGHPSQAEGEDPAANGTGQETTATGHPSQAEGEDPDAA